MTTPADDERREAEERLFEEPEAPYSTADWDWRRRLNLLRFSGVRPTDRPGDTGRRGRLWYRLDLASSRRTGQLIVDVFDQRVKRDGTLSEIRACPLDLGNPEDFYGGDDAELLNVLSATAETLRPQMRLTNRYSDYQQAPWSSFVPPLLVPSLLPRLAATGRLVVARDLKLSSVKVPLDWDGAAPWRFGLRLGRDGDDGDGGGEDRFLLTGVLRRGEETRGLDEARLVTAGAVLFDRSLAAFDAGEQVHWAWLLRDGPISVSEAQVEALLEELWKLPEMPEVEMPPGWELEETSLRPRPRLVVRVPRTSAAESLRCDVGFFYDGCEVWAGDDRTQLLDLSKRRLLRRDAGAEAAALDRLADLGAEVVDDLYLTVEAEPGRFSELVTTLVAEGWRVEAEGKKVRRAGALRLYVSSGIDWFELSGKADFEGVQLLLPELLAALRDKTRLVVLGDGTCGLLPEEWIERYTPLAALAPQEAEVFYFSATEAFFIETLLDGVDVESDERFEELRKRLRALRELPECREPPGFQGELRAYQREGLSWLRFLEELGLGGCLADDMGLGKTVQLLALFEDRRRGGRRQGPSLVVVPKSLVFNWIEEAARFTPALRVLGFSGPGRGVFLERLDAYDVVVTTYGTLRRDAEKLAEVRFDYIVLDEAQAIKNVLSKTARACRSLSARHRLALTGTPVENHLGELGSIFAFLNPGMLQRFPALGELTAQPSLDAPSLDVVRRALRPFILRRTKGAVLSELPEKSEQVLYCEMTAKGRRLYEELRDHYRAEIERQIAEQGFGRSKVKVLEALLRLRQAACHPALVDETRHRESSAKLDVFLDHLDQVLAEGHKALVFSQFVSFLTLVREPLDRRHVRYEYLDGSTRNRRERVAHFQEDDGCRLFLISLKAGGVGLNLTAADYVYLLDPWWNPAVEAQAMDRAHRIGQERPVFAYRLISRGTVEEKILELQAKKRELAEAVLAADERFMASLSVDDLRWLLS